MKMNKRQRLCIISFLFSHNFGPETRKIDRNENVEWQANNCKAKLVAMLQPAPTTTTVQIIAQSMHI